MTERLSSTLPKPDALSGSGSSPASLPSPMSGTQPSASSDVQPARRQDAAVRKVSQRRGQVQIGISAMLLLVIVAAVISAGLVYAARIPEIQEEMAVLFGTEVTADRTRRGPQILFILFTLTSPLLLAMGLSTAMGIWNSLAKH